MKDKSKVTTLASLDPSSTRSSKKVIRDSSRPSFDKPTPLNFDAFLPWVCLEWQSPEIVVVTRIVQEEYIKNERRSSSSRSRSTKSVKSKHDDLESIAEPKNGTSVLAPSGEAEFKARSSLVDTVVPIKAYYDTRGYLVEVAIINCQSNIHRKVIQAISICIPFHSLLTKLTIRRGGVTNVLLYEVGKMLPHSNLTDVCLDDCIVPEGKYDAILEHTSQLKYLSLNRCGIDNTKCMALAKKIDFGAPGSTLLVLELGSNLISDKGAMALSETLRRNRRLVHLNLSGNKITDASAISMLSHLMEYKLTWNEIVDARQRKLKYTEKKMAVYASCYENVMKQQKSDMLGRRSTTTRKSINKTLKIPKEDTRKKKKVPSVFIEEKSAVDIAVAMTLDIVGKFVDPYDENCVVTKEEHLHSKGNMVLCSLNLAYTNLSFMSVKKICEVLKYQDRMEKPSGATGLMRILFDGNNIPVHCVEYDRIEMFLKRAINENTPIASSSYHKKRTISASASRRF